MHHSKRQGNRTTFCVCSSCLNILAMLLESVVYAAGRNKGNSTLHGFSPCRLMPPMESIIAFNPSFRILVIFRGRDWSSRPRSLVWTRQAINTVTARPESPHLTTLISPQVWKFHSSRPSLCRLAKPIQCLLPKSSSPTRLLTQVGLVKAAAYKSGSSSSGRGMAAASVISL